MLNFWGGYIYKSYRIHVWYVYQHVPNNQQLNVGEKIGHMDPNGILTNTFHPGDITPLSFWSKESRIPIRKR